MPIVFAQREPLDESLIGEYAAMQQQNQDRDYGLRRDMAEAQLSDQAFRQSLAAQGQEQAAYQFEASRQPSDRDMWAAQQQQGMVQQQFANQMQALSRAEQLRMESLQKQRDHLQTLHQQGNITDDELREGIAQVEGVRGPLALRHAASQQRAEELQFEQMRRTALRQAGLQRAIESGNQTEVARLARQNQWEEDDPENPGQKIRFQVDPRSGAVTEVYSQTQEHRRQERARREERREMQRAHFVERAITAVDEAIKNQTFQYKPPPVGETTPQQLAARQAREREEAITERARMAMAAWERLQRESTGQQPATTQGNTPDERRFEAAIGAISAGRQQLPEGSSRWARPGQEHPAVEGTPAYTVLPSIYRWATGEPEQPLQPLDPQQQLPQTERRELENVIARIARETQNRGVGQQILGTRDDNWLALELLQIRRTRNWTGREADLFRRVYERNREAKISGPGVSSQRGLRARSLANAMSRFLPQ